MKAQVEWRIAGPNGPRVFVPDGTGIEAVEEALVGSGWTVHPDDWGNGVKVSGGHWHPLSVATVSGGLPEAA